MWDRFVELDQPNDLYATMHVIAPRHKIGRDILTGSLVAT